VHFPEEVLYRLRRLIPPEWMLGDDASLDAVLERLMSRCHRVPDLIAASVQGRVNPFPRWAEASREYTLSASSLSLDTPTTLGVLDTTSACRLKERSDVVDETLRLPPTLSLLLGRGGSEELPVAPETGPE
jgi:hypothetical protein